MGMFDEVHYEGRVYQTKDLDCLMARYYVESGKLLRSVGKTTLVPKKDRPYPKGTGIRAIFGSMKYTETSREDTKFDGVLHIYDSEKYLKLKFTDGILANVEDATLAMKWNDMTPSVGFNKLAKKIKKSKVKK